MRGWIALWWAGVSLLVTGCTAVTKELRHPAGYPGYVLDKRTFDASESKSLQLLRLTLALAIAARVGEAQVSTRDADTFAKQLAEAATQVNYAAASLYPAPATVGGPVRPACRVKDAPADQTDENCAGYFVNFEVEASRAEERIVRTMLTALPTDQARKFLEGLTGGDLMGAAFSVLRAFGDVAGAFHRATGVYRTGEEIVSLNMRGCHLDAGMPEEATMTVIDAAACLGLSQSDLFDHDDAGAGLFQKTVTPQAFDALMRIGRTACVSLPLASELEMEKLRESRRLRSAACELIRFRPSRRLDQLPPDGDDPGTQGLQIVEPAPSPQP